MTKTSGPKVTCIHIEGADIDYDLVEKNRALERENQVLKMKLQLLLDYAAVSKLEAVKLHLQ